MSARRWAWLGAVLLVVTVVVGVAGASRLTPAAVVPLSVEAAIDRARPEFGAVAVRGLDRSLVNWLRGRDASDAAWRRVIVVVATPDSGRPSDPPVAGRYRVDGDVVRFVPLFPPAGGLTYAVHVATRPELDHLPGDPEARDARGERTGVIVRRFAIPAEAPRAATARVVAVYPAADTIPANQLRWYVEFSAPMRPGEALDRVHLIDPQGREVAGAFLSTGDELWDARGRRLTLLFDPGRVKRGIRTNVEEGRPVRAGGRYTLRVDAAWRDAMGAPLVGPYEKRFVVGPEDYRLVDPRRWGLKAPDAGTRAPVRVAFGESLDHALAEHMLRVTDSAGRTVPGAATLGAADRTWEFTPTEPWRPQAYAVQVGVELEDVAGNRQTRAFDTDLASATVGPAETATPTRDVTSAPFRREFRPRSQMVH